MGHRISIIYCHCSNFSIILSTFRNRNFIWNVLGDVFIVIGSHLNCIIYCIAILNLEPNLVSTLSSNHLSKSAQYKIISSWRSLLLNWITILFLIRCPLLDLHYHTSSKMLHLAEVCSFTISVRIISCREIENDRIFYLFWISRFDSLWVSHRCK